MEAGKRKLNIKTMENITDEKKTITISPQNVDVKRNPITTIFSVVLMLIGCMMYAIEYVLPAFMTLKEKVTIPWWAPLAVIGVSLLLAFMNDSVFARLFNRFDKTVEKVTHTESKE